VLREVIRKHLEPDHSNRRCVALVANCAAGAPAEERNRKIVCHGANLTNQANRRDEGRAAPPVKLRVERQVDRVPQLAN